MEKIWLTAAGRFDIRLNRHISEDSMEKIVLHPNLVIDILGLLKERFHGPDEVFAEFLEHPLMLEIMEDENEYYIDEELRTEPHDLDTSPREDVLYVVSKILTGMHWPLGGDSSMYREEWARKFARAMHERDMYYIHRQSKKPENTK